MEVGTLLYPHKVVHVSTREQVEAASCATYSRWYKPYNGSTMVDPEDDALLDLRSN